MKKALFSIMTLVLVLGLALPIAAPALADTVPSIWTDKPDYSPEDTVIISGSGFDTNIDLLVRVTRPDGSVITGDGSWTPGSDTITTDGEGAFTYNYKLDGVYGLYTVDVLQGDTVLATTTFTDGPKLGSVTVGSQTGTLTAGTPGSGNYTITVYRGNGSGSSGSFDAALSITTTLPTGATYSFSPITVSFAPTDGNKTSILTITTTLATPAGNTTFTVQAFNNPSEYAYGNGTLTVAITSCTAPSITANPSGQTKVVGESVTFSVTATGTTPLSYQWRKGGGNISGATNSSLTMGSVIVSDSGSYDVVVSNSCGSAISSAATLTVNQATPVITWSNPADITYGTALSGTQLNASASVPGNLTYTPAAGTVLSAGNNQNLHVDFTPTDTANYNNATKDVTINVIPRPITVTADPQTKTYGNADPELTYKFTPALVGTDSFSGNLTRDAGENVGDYDITQGTLAINDGNSGNNYDFTFKDGNLTITQALLTVTADDTSREYGEANPTFTASYSGFKNGEILATSDVTGDPSLTTTADATSPVSGSPYTITAALGTLASGNYGFSFVNGNLTITQATLTVTADNKSREYGEANPTFTASYSGFKNGEILATSDVTGDPSLTCTATPTSPVSGSPYTITAAIGSLASGNYDFTFAAGNLTITQALLTVTADDKSREYGEANPTFTASYSGFKNGETLATSDVTGDPSLTCTATPTSPVSGSPYTITAAIGSLASGNYDFTFAAGNLTITQATLTVTAENKSREYGETNPTFTASYSGFKNGEILGTSDVTGDPSLTCTATTASPVSGSPYIITAALGSLASGNYGFSFVNGNLTITQATLTVTAENKSREYGETNPTFTASYSGFKNGEILGTSDVTGDPSLTCTATTASPVSGSPYIITAALGSLASGNYGFSFVNGNLTITQATLTVTAENKSHQYSDPNPTLTYNITGFKNGETLATSGVTGIADLSTTATQYSQAGTYPITCSIGTLTAANYSFTFVNGIMTVTKEDASIEYTGDSFVYTAGPSINTAPVRLACTLIQDPDGYPGNLTLAKVRFELFKFSNSSGTPDQVVGNIPVNAAGEALTIVNLGVDDCWTVYVKIEPTNAYWTQSEIGMGTLTVALGSNDKRVTGGGWIPDSQSSNGKGNFGFTVNYQKNGTPKGNSLYLFRGTDGFNYKVKSNSWQDGGLWFTGTYKAYFSGKCNVQKIDRATGAIVETLSPYRFTVDIWDGDLTNPKAPDRYAITILDGSGNVWRQIGTPATPIQLGGGNVVIRNK